MEDTYKELINKCRFKVIKTSYTVRGQFYKRLTIALQDIETELNIWFPDFADYILYLRHDDLSFEAKNEPGIYAVEQFLNYVFIDNYEKYRIKSIEEITLDSIKDFLNYYSDSRTKQGNYPSRQSIKAKRDNISIFLWNECYQHPNTMKYLKCNDLLEKVKKKNKENYYQLQNDYKIKYRYHKNDSSGRVYRDMPMELVERFIKMAEIYDPEIVFAIVLLAYTGLRKSEICNIRQKYGSCYGVGMIINEIQEVQKINGKEIAKKWCQSIEFDLNKELLLRNDGVDVGSIKKERPQPVYPGYKDIIYHYYQKHINLVEKKETEIFKPLFINKTPDKKTGKYKALTSKSLTKRIKKLFYQHVVPSLERDNNYKFQLFFKEIERHTWGLHAFRHWFTVSLVLKGCDERQIQEYRGDASPKSARHYLERKGELQILYDGAVDEIAYMITGEK